MRILIFAIVVLIVKAFQPDIYAGDTIKEFLAIIGVILFAFDCITIFSKHN